MELAILIGNRHAGTLHLPSGADPSFEYLPRYIGQPGPPLSAQFPLSSGGGEGEKLRWWLEGLLPDDTETIRSLLREHDLQSQDYAQMLGTPMGTDCAGAVQFCPPDEAPALITKQGGQTPITEVEIADWLRQVQADPARRAYRGKGADSGFSLAGMQPKIAVRRIQESGWAVPQGPNPTTHIIKAARHQMFPHEAITEHLIMETAARCGLAAARTSTADFDDNMEVLVVERFDRTPDGTARIHQEDLCQALGYRPDQKYQREGGPGPKEVAALLRQADPASAEANTSRFLDSLLYMWVTASIDAHAKNYSLMHPAAGIAVLSPVYDTNSWLPYRKDQPISIFRLAMRMGDDYTIASADQPASLTRLAEQLGLETGTTANRAADLASRVPAALGAAIETLPPEKASLPIVEKLRRELGSRADLCKETATEAARLIAPTNANDGP